MVRESASAIINSFLLGHSTRELVDRIAIKRIPERNEATELVHAPAFFAVDIHRIITNIRSHLKYFLSIWILDDGIPTSILVPELWF